MKWNQIWSFIIKVQYIWVFFFIFLHHVSKIFFKKKVVLDRPENSVYISKTIKLIQSVSILIYPIQRSELLIRASFVDLLLLLISNETCLTRHLCNNVSYCFISFIARKKIFQLGHTLPPQPYNFWIIITQPTSRWKLRLSHGWFYLYFYILAANCM